MSCKHDCARPLRFPRRIHNRPGLSRIDYALGAYADVREYLFARLNTATPLPEWAAEHPHEEGARALAALMPDLGGASSQPLQTFTHRHADDPGIALLEGAALVGDILAFYQTLYANEAYLRTARWRDSVADLVRLLGYRLAPGLGGRARFALAVKGARPLAVPAGFALKAQLAGGGPPAVFETGRALTAHAHLGRFHLYRPRFTPPIVAGTNTFAVAGAVELRAGDRLFAGVPRTLAFGGGECLDRPQVLVVDDTWEAFGTRIVRITGSITGAGAAVSVRAYKLAASVRHFGHNAPAKQVLVGPDGHTSQVDVDFDRILLDRQLPLDGDVPDAVAGGTVLVQMGARVLVRAVESAAARTLDWGPQSGAATELTLDHQLGVIDGGTLHLVADIREVTAHLAGGAPFTLSAEPRPTLAASGTELDFFGTAAEVGALQKRPLLLAYADGRRTDAHVAAVDAAAPATAEAALLRRVRLDVTVDYVDFPHAEPSVDVYGNLVDATQGKSEDEVVLGDGHAGQSFQSFELPKAPLTYLLEAGAEADRTPELQVFVAGIRWTRVDSLFGRAPDARVYVVRETAAGHSVVQFGDGKSGAQLPSGKGNVVARYRTGSGAHGGLDGDAKPQPARKLPGFDQAFLPRPVTGGAEPESEASARTAAPGTMQSLGRIVSLADYEAEALAIPGIIKARATFNEMGTTPRISVVVLTASESSADAEAAAEVLRRRHASRGMARQPLTVVQGHRRPVRLGLEVGIDPARRAADVRAAILAALGAAGDEAGEAADGLLSWQQRQFGEDLHGSHVLAAVQQVGGVSWARLTRFDPGKNLPLAGGVDPAVELAQRTLRCPATRIFVLDSADVVLQLVQAAEAAEAAP